MAEITDNYSLIKPEQGDYYNVDDFNENADILDAAVYAAKLKADKADRKSILIAAQNSAADFKNMADHICAARDETVFQAAADRAAETGCTVYIAPGDYDVYTLDIDGDAVFIGLGEVNITTGVRSFFIGAGRTVFKNIAFLENGVYLKPRIESAVFDGCRFVHGEGNCIKIDGDYVLTDKVPMVIINNCDFIYTGSGTVPQHSFIFYVNDTSLQYHISVTGSRCSGKSYIAWGIDYDNGSIISCEGCINISPMEPRTGNAVIPAGHTSLTKDVSKAWDGAEADYRYDTEHFAYVIEVTANDRANAVMPVFDAVNKNAVFMLGEASQSDIAISYRIVPVGI